MPTYMPATYVGICPSAYAGIYLQPSICRHICRMPAFSIYTDICRVSHAGCPGQLGGSSSPFTVNYIFQLILRRTDSLCLSRLDDNFNTGRDLDRVQNYTLRADTKTYAAYAGIYAACRHGDICRHMLEDRYMPAYADGHMPVRAHADICRRHICPLTGQYHRDRGIVVMDSPALLTTTPV